MTTIHTFALTLHVVTAVLGLGQVTAIAILASTATGRVSGGEAPWTALARLMRGTRWTLVIMLLSGVLVEYASGGAYHGTWWFRLSFFILLALGVINARMCRILRKRDSVGDDRALKAIVRSAWLMCGMTAVITILMEIKRPW
jgi:hypothetical protein